jgi:outer membrane immunogenic protein
MKTLISASIFAIGIIIGSSAYAADMAVKAPPAAPAPYVAYNWTGFYVGGEFGVGWGSSTATVVTAPAITGFPVGSMSTGDRRGALGGIYGGYNYQINQFLVGIDGDYTWADLTGDHTEVSPVNGDIAQHHDLVDWVATATGRVGYAWDNWLLFAKGGWAWAGFSSSTDVSNSAGELGGISLSQETRDGWTVGGGFEYGFTQHLSFKVEYDYVKFETANFSDNSMDIAHPDLSGSYARSATSNLNMVKVGLGLRY